MGQATTVNRGQYKAEYNALKNAIHRCHATHSAAYSRYGGRGLAVWAGWRDPLYGFWAFFEHIGPRPSDQHSLDRIDNDRGYFPGNVRWATRVEQQNNRRPKSRQVTDYGHGVGRTKPRRVGRGHGARSSPLLPYRGQVKTLRDWAILLDIAPATIRARLDRGRTVEEALAQTNYRKGYAKQAVTQPTIH